MPKAKSYLIVYDLDGDVCLAKTALTDAQARRAECMSSVYQVRQLPLNDLDEMTAEEVFELRSEFDDEE